LVLLIEGHYNTINSNVYRLIESILILWQFSNWRLLKNRNTKIVAGTALVWFWLIENFIIFNPDHFNSYFLIAYSSMVSIMSIGMLNHLIISERKSLLKNPIFLICAAYIFYYTFSVLSEAFWLYGIDQSKNLSAHVHAIASITNFISILLYSAAIIWMPR